MAEIFFNKGKQIEKGANSIPTSVKSHMHISFVHRVEHFIPLFTNVLPSLLNKFHSSELYGLKILGNQSCETVCLTIT